ncbi:hypothetical protein BDV06DRAFT_218735 [Aspergillus oleicola]
MANNGPSRPRAATGPERVRDEEHLTSPLTVALTVAVDGPPAWLQIKAQRLASVGAVQQLRGRGKVSATECPAYHCARHFEAARMATSLWPGQTRRPSSAWRTSPLCIPEMETSTRKHLPSDRLSAVQEGGSPPDSETGEEPPDNAHHDVVDEPLHDIPGEHHDYDEHTPELNPLPPRKLRRSRLSRRPTPLVQEDDVHNKHTVWSVIRTYHREALAEPLAVFIQLIMGLVADLSVTLGGRTNLNTTAWA